jgi:protein SCO1/2
MRFSRAAAIAFAALSAFSAPALAHSLKDVDRDPFAKEEYFQPMDVQAPDFNLRDAAGKPVGLVDFRGKVVVLNFIYTNCPDVCPLQSEKIAQLQTMINATSMKESVQFVTITTDPKRDTGKVLSDYGLAHGLDPVSWIFLTAASGEPEDTTRKIAKAYGLEFTPGEAGAQMHGIVTHVIDRDGRMRARFHGLKFEPANFRSFRQRAREPRAAASPGGAGSLGAAERAVLMADEPGNDEAKDGPPARRVGANRLTRAALGVSVVSITVSLFALLFAAGVLPIRGGAFETQALAFVRAHPEAIIESIHMLDARQKVAETDEVSAALGQKDDEIFNDASAPVGVNPKGKTLLVEFFDYNCPYCRKEAPILAAAEKADPELRVVYKEFPILGPGSTFAARAALASRTQGKYLAFHDAMFAHPGAIAESSALEIAAQVGLDVERLKKDMQDRAIDAAIKRNLALADALHISGTPTFVAGQQVHPGLVDADGMKSLIAAARGE